MGYVKCKKTISFTENVSIVYHKVDNSIFHAQKLLQFLRWAINLS